MYQITDIAAEVAARWSDPATRPLFKGSLIDDDGCCCAQGDVLRHCGWSDAQLREAEQYAADLETARLLGISRAHSCLLRIVNDRRDGCPQDVLLHPERVLGDQAPRVLAFWHRLDGLTDEQWATAGATAWATARATACDAAWTAARDAAGVNARDAARDATGGAAGGAAGASNEIQGAVLMRERGQSFFFLPIFGINDPAELDG